MSDEKSQLLATLAPILDHLSTVDPAGGRATADSLDAAFPVDGELLSQVRAEVVAGLQAGWLTPREGGGVRYGRLSKAVDGSRGFSIDAVDMSGPGPGHTHPNGEIDLCFALEEGARFDGRPEGWVVYGPDSWHIPTVSGGRMAILYFLPGGAIRFGPRPS